MLVLYHSWSICYVHGSYDSNLGSEILSLGGDISSRSWLNIGDSYGTCNPHNVYVHITGNILRHRDSLHFLWGKHLQCRQGGQKSSKVSDVIYGRSLKQASWIAGMVNYLSLEAKSYSKVLHSVQNKIKEAQLGLIKRNSNVLGFNK